MSSEVLQDLPPAAAVGGGRAEIDTSAPFESVREAVDRFGGSAAWSSHLVRRIFAHHKKQEQCVVGSGTEDEQCVNSLEEQTAQLEKELGVKERETLDVLKELESAKRVIADLRLKIQNQTADTLAKPEEKQPDEDTCCHITEASTAEPEEKQPQDNCCITEVYAATAEGWDTAEPEEERLPEGNAEADVEMCGGGLDQQEQQHPALVLMELGQAKSNLCRTTTDLAAIRASIESLRTEIASEKMLVERRREKVSSDATMVSSLEEELDQTTQRLQTLKDLQRRREDPSDIFMEIKKMTSEIEQLRNAANASKSEAMMLAAEIEETKAAIGTAEVRCLAAKKIEEAARAAEALAVAEIKALLCSEASAEDLQGTDGVVDLSVEEYLELASKAREADESSRNRIAAAMVHVDEANQSRSESLTRLEEAQLEVEECKSALQEALKRVDTANRGKFAVEETIRRWRSENVHKRRSLRGSPRFKHAAPRQKDSHCMDIVDVSSNSLKPTLSIGQILSMKLMGPDGYDKSVSDDTSETSNVSSLGQILNRKQAILYSGDTSASKKLSGKRKKFAFTGLSVFLAKQAKSKKKRASD